MRETEALRGLPFRAPVRAFVEDRRAIGGYVARAIDELQLTRARRRYLALGVLEPSLDIRAHVLAVMQEELIGYYDPSEQRLVLRDDVARVLTTPSATSARDLGWQATVVHELVHALQDQHFGLREAVHAQRSTDADNAFGALVEGDATLVTLAYTAQRAGVSLQQLTADPDAVFDALSRAPSAAGGALQRAPALLREPLLFRYREGARFCAASFRAGGWRRVNDAHRDPPRTTHAIVARGGYAPHARTYELPLPSLDWLSDADLERRDDDVLGSLELAIVLTPTGLAPAAVANAWRGDHYVVLDRAGELASLWWLRFASPQLARRIARAFERLGDSTRQVIQRGALVVVGRHVEADTLMRAADPRVQASLELSRDAHRDLAQHAFHKRGYPLASTSHEN